MINIITCMDKNNVIGLNNKLPWHLPKDLKHFQDTTKGHMVVMGRKTFESLPNGRLKGRFNVVLTSDERFFAKGVYVCNTVNEVLTLEQYCGNDIEIFIIGGSMVYEEFLPLADKLYVTRVQGEFVGDSYFPEIDYAQWKPIQSSIKEDVDGDHKLYFVTYERVKD